MGEEVAFNRSLKLQFDLNVSKFWDVLFSSRVNVTCGFFFILVNDSDRKLTFPLHGEGLGDPS